MLVAVMCGMLLPFAVLHYLDYTSLTWRVGWRWLEPWKSSLLGKSFGQVGHRERNFCQHSCEGYCTMTCPPGPRSVEPLQSLDTDTS